MNCPTKAEVYDTVRHKSAKTSVNQVPALHKKINWRFGDTNLDIGGGKYEAATEYLNSKGVNNLVYDPYNRSKEHNTNVLSHYIYNTATIANVLNVIMTDEERVRALETAQSYVQPGGKIYISVYEGNKSGKPSISSIGTYQENKKLKEYLHIVCQVWDPKYVKLKKNMIEVKNGDDPTLRLMCPSCLQLPDSGDV
jgi:hypothetical protein